MGIEYSLENDEQRVGTFAQRKYKPIAARILTARTGASQLSDLVKGHILDA